MILQNKGILYQVPLFFCAFSIEKCGIVRYNLQENVRQKLKFLRCSIPCYFEPTIFLWVSYIADWMSGRHLVAEGRREAAVTHLALARTQNCRKRHFGFLPYFAQWHRGIPTGYFLKTYMLWESKDKCIKLQKNLRNRRFLCTEDES